MFKIDTDIILHVILYQYIVFQFCYYQLLTLLSNYAQKDTLITSLCSVPYT